MKETLLHWLNTVLVANFFFVLFAFLWFAIALIGRLTGIPLGFNLWHRLWEPVFTPAIGILMGGTIFTGLVAKLNQWFHSKSGNEAKTKVLFT